MILATIEGRLLEKQRKLAESGSDVSEAMDAMTHLLMKSGGAEPLSLDEISVSCVCVCVCVFETECIYRKQSDDACPFLLTHVFLAVNKCIYLYKGSLWLSGKHACLPRR